MSLSKSTQLKKNGRLKPAPFKDKVYLSWFHNQGFGCMVCGNTLIEAHHVKEHSTDLKDDRYLLPLCEFHHKYSDYLSPHGAPTKWREAYPIEVQKSIAKKLYDIYKGESCTI